MTCSLCSCVGTSFATLALALASRSLSFIMSVCSLVIDRIGVCQDGKKLQRPARVIVACEDHITGEIVCSSKYIHYPRGDIIHNEYAYNYNGIDATTLSTHGEKFAAVVDWVRSAIRCRVVVVCGVVDLEHFVEEASGCRVVDLQDFFITRNEAGIDEPVSLARLAKRFYNYDSKRDAFADARMKIGLFYIMKAFKLSRIVTPPFAEQWFPKNTANYKPASVLKRLQNVTLEEHKPTLHTVRDLCQTCVKQQSFSEQSRFQASESLDKHTYENDTDNDEPLISVSAKDQADWP